MTDWVILPVRAPRFCLLSMAVRLCSTDCLAAWECLSQGSIGRGDRGFSASGGVGERQDRVEVISLWEIKSEGLPKTRGMAWLGASVAKGWESGISVPNFPLSERAVTSKGRHLRNTGTVNPL